MEVIFDNSELHPKYKGKYVVWALHPAQPASDGGYHSRGRKKHLADKEDSKLTLCNMTNDGRFYKYEVDNGMCKNCLKQLDTNPLETEKN